MPRIIPIKDLKDTAAISQLCRESAEPVFITKNGYGDMVIMSIEAYEKNLMMQDVLAKLDEAEASIAAGKGIPAKESIARLREKYGL